MSALTPLSRGFELRFAVAFEDDPIALGATPEAEGRVLAGQLGEGGQQPHRVIGGPGADGTFEEVRGLCHARR